MWTQQLWIKVIQDLVKDVGSEDELLFTSFSHLKFCRYILVLVEFKVECIIWLRSCQIKYQLQPCLKINITMPVDILIWQVHRQPFFVAAAPLLLGHFCWVPKESRFWNQPVLLTLLYLTEEKTFFEVYSSSVLCTELSLFIYANVNTAFHSMALLRTSWRTLQLSWMSYTNQEFS